jgi:predicted GIY-YIG superfamily endonuclease
MATTIYVLRLSSGKFYVGKTDDMGRRWQEHLSGGGSSWTRKYKPVGIEKVIKNASPFEEDMVTKEYMSKHGIENVRGGTYVTETLDIIQQHTLQTEIWQAKGCCTRCGRTGHFIKACSAKTTVNGEEFDDDEEEDEEDEEQDEYGCNYCDRTFTSAFGCRIHEKSCMEKGGCGGVYEKSYTAKARTSYDKKPTAKKEGACYRCGRAGHYSPDCYASRHVKGYELD